MLNRGWAPLTGVLVGRDKFIDLPIPERYDLFADHEERRNLAGRDPERDRTLIAVLRGFGAAVPGERATEDADAAARLRALGYTSTSAARKSAYTDADDPKTLIGLDQAVHRAVESFDAGRVDEAEQIYRQVIAARPDMAIAYRHLAFIEARRGHVAGAVELLQSALRAGVTDRRVLTLLGEYLADSGRVDQGIHVLEPLASDPRADADMLNTLGIAYAQAGRADAARRAFERVLAINPNSSVPLENLGMLSLERGDLRTARTYYERAVAVDSRSSRAYGGLGVVALRSGDRDEAVAVWKTAVGLDPTNLEALYNLGTTLARNGEAAAARPYLEQFLKTAPLQAERDRHEVARLLKDIS